MYIKKNMKFYILCESKGKFTIAYFEGVFLFCWIVTIFDDVEVCALYINYTNIGLSWTLI